MTIFGLVFGTTLITIAIMLGGSILDFVNIEGIFIVIGGVTAAIAISFPMEVIKNLMPLMMNALKSKPVDYRKDIEEIVKIANIARREGILALEESVNDMEDPFMQKGIMLVIDGSDPELVKSVLETELMFTKERHSSGQGVLMQCSAYAPAFGMMGTVIGLINMLNAMDDPGALGPAMAVAVITTFYGLILANLLFTPFAKKLGVQGANELLRKEMILEGILSIQNGENPRIIREKLNAFLPHSQAVKEGDVVSGSPQSASAD